MLRPLMARFLAIVAALYERAGDVRARLSNSRSLKARFSVAVARRLPLVAAAAFLALMSRCGLEDPPEATPAGVAGMLGRSIGGGVDANEFIWEPSRGPLVDALLGRDVLFLAKADGAEYRDLY